MGISVGVFGLLHDTVAGARALVRGVSRLPEHLNRRLIRTHAEADAAEHARQVALVGSSQNVPAFSEAGEHLLAELRALQAKGVDVRIEQAADGQIIISLVSAEHRSLALVEAKKLLLAFPSRPGDTGSEEQRRPGDPEAPRG